MSMDACELLLRNRATSRAGFVSAWPYSGEHAQVNSCRSTHALLIATANCGSGAMSEKHRTSVSWLLRQDARIADPASAAPEYRAAWSVTRRERSGCECATPSSPSALDQRLDRERS